MKQIVPFRSETPPPDTAPVGDAPLRRRRHLEVALFPGSLTAIPARGYLLGLFQGVVPGGAAAAVDRLMNGVISDFVQRRMLSGRLGEVFIVPKGRSAVAADHVIFVGLGPFDRFKLAHSTESGEPDAMRLVCESVVRCCLHANIEEFATVLVGASATDSADEAVGLFAHGFLDALRIADPTGRLRRITLCERDPQRMAEIRAAIQRLAKAAPAAPIEIELLELPAPAEPDPTVAGTASAPSVTARATPLYLLARMVELGDARPGAGADRRPRPARVQIETSVLTNRGKAAVLTSTTIVSVRRRDSLLATIRSDPFNPAKLERLGRGLVRLVCDADLRAALDQGPGGFRDSPVVVVHDAVAAQLPWEALRVGDWSPALTGGLTRQHLDANLSVAKWLEERQVDEHLDVLLVTNPTGDLVGSEREGTALRTLLEAIPGVRVATRRRSEATKAQLLADFRSGQFDVIHYAGHAFFSPQHPGRSGLLCAGQEVLAGTDLAGLSNLPALIFFNACESGRLGSARRAGTGPAIRRPQRDNLSVAAAFIRGGVANFLGTYWPVGDRAAKQFAEAFYPLLVRGATIGEAVLAGRHALQAAGSVDWADYLLYGNPAFSLKRLPA
ncbi:MAG: CHAT domain-containing protein [Verrucomicrobia bacterium]|nr:CHAT domain-containing protein [Verrucomicrobiota bacterium]